jgi:hypothetical protein
MRAVNANPGDELKALNRMRSEGAHLVSSREILNLAGSSATAR